MPSKVTFFAPGKLFIAGEYAVTENLGEAIIYPVLKGITVSIQNQKVSSILNLQYPGENITFTSIHEIKNPYLRLAMEVVRQWMMAKQIGWKTFKMTIDSSLVSEQGKYGLGSSGAITVAVIGALLKFYGVDFTPLQLYQLAVIATIQNYQDTSFGDIACSSFNQPIHYRKFSKAMMSMIKTLHVETLLKMDWVGLKIEPIRNPIEKPLVVYSGSSANSYDMVNKVKPHIHEAWIKKSNLLLQALLKGHDSKMISQLQEHLMKLSKISGTEFVTPGMEKIFEVASELGGTGKMSGAGGGDCVIIYLPRQQHPSFKAKMKALKFLVLSDII
ncbi:MAG: hypothetical protein RL379_546 [Bacillota bacterium]|jgi:phosphomevalonate kinase